MAGGGGCPAALPRFPPAPSPPVGAGGLAPSLSESRPPEPRPWRLCLPSPAEPSRGQPSRAEPSRREGTRGRPCPALAVGRPARLGRSRQPRVIMGGYLFSCPRRGRPQSAGRGPRAPRGLRAVSPVRGSGAAAARRPCCCVGVWNRLHRGTPLS